MRRVVVLGVCLLAGCADILGIDDGVPRDAATVDAPFDAPLDVHASDANDGGAVSPLSCGTSTCNFALGQSCCRTGATTFVCLDAGTACKGTAIPCDRPEQCTGGDAGPLECCTTDVLTDAGTYVATSVGCMTKAQCSPIPAHYILCGDGDGSADCPDGTSCGQSTSTLPTFLICR